MGRDQGAEEGEGEEAVVASQAAKNVAADQLFQLFQLFHCSRSRRQRH